jgi:hypothetical protein
LQSAYSSDEESELSAQATVDISRHDLDKVMGETEAGSAKHAEHDAHAVPAGSVHPEQAPPFKTLDRQGTKYFDAGKSMATSGPHTNFLVIRHKANALNGRPTWYDLSLNFTPSLCHLAHEQAATMAVQNANRSLEVVSRGLLRFWP